MTSRNKIVLVIAALAAFFVFAIPAAATHESFVYDPPPESGAVAYDAGPVDVPFSFDPLEFCVDPPPETAVVAGDSITVDPPRRCVDPPPVSGSVVYDAPSVNVPYTHDPPPRSVPIPHDPPPPSAPQCSDGIDNDGDGLVDYPADPGCSSATDDDEANAAPPPPPPPPPIGNCLVSNRTDWALAGADCFYGTLINLTNEQFRCSQPLANYGPLPLKLVWNFTGNPDFGDQGHLDFLNGCRGDGNSDTIDVIVASNADGVTVGAAGGAGKFRTAGPIDIQITGNFDCGPLGSSGAHQDTWQFHPDWPVARLDIVNGTSGDWDAGTATCIGAGGAIFFSNRYDVDVFGGRYVTCNHGYFGNSSSSNLVVDAGFRTGRTDGSDPKCDPYNPSDPCLGPSAFSPPAAQFTNVICQRWLNGAWQNRPPPG